MSENVCHKKPISQRNIETPVAVSLKSGDFQGTREKSHLFHSLVLEYIKDFVLKMKWATGFGLGPASSCAHIP